MKALPVDPLELKYIQVEVSEKLPQGKLACGNQAFLATLLFDPSMSALPLTGMHKSQRVGLFPHSKGT